MSENTLKRAAEAPHVVAAKNLATIYTQMGGKRSTFLENHAKRKGYGSWNAYREAAHTEVFLDYIIKSHEKTLKADVHTAARSVFEHVAAAVVHAATKAGYSCDHSAPLVITKSIDLYVPLLNVGSLVLRRSFTPRSFCLMPQDLAGDDIVELIADQMPSFSGILILDLPDITAAAIAVAQRTWPDALILTHKHAPQSAATFDPLFDGQTAMANGDLPVIPRLRTLDGEMWAQRTLSMLRSFAISGVPFDPRRIPTVHDLDISHSAMLRFVESIPGFSVDKRSDPRGRQRQERKAEEQYGFLIMNIFACGGDDCAIDEFRPSWKSSPELDDDVLVYRQSLSFDQILEMISAAANRGASDIHVICSSGSIKLRLGPTSMRRGIQMFAQLSPEHAQDLIRDVFARIEDSGHDTSGVYRIGAVLPESGLLPPKIAKLRVTHEQRSDGDLMIMRLIPFASTET